MKRIVLKDVKSFVLENPILVVVLFLILIAVGYSSATQIHGFLIQTGVVKSSLAPDAPIVYIKQPATLKESSLPITPTTVEPTVAKTPRSVVAPTPSSVGGVEPASSSGGAVATGYTSSNWAGYFATGGSYSSVSGSWTVPRPSGNGVSTSGDAAWIGIGGATTTDLIQVGTEDQVSASGQVYTAIFYELLPASAKIVTTVPINPGDVITASLFGVNNVWTIKATDVTTGQVFQTTVGYASSLSSAEWIEEDPSLETGELAPFDNFGTISFTGGSAVRNGVSGSIVAVGGKALTLVNAAGRSLATPSGLSGGSFNVTRN